MDRLNQSLDDIISTRNKEKPVRRQRGGKKEGGRGGGAMKSRGKRQERNVSSAPYDAAPSNIRKPHLVQPSGQQEAQRKQPIAARLGAKGGSIMSRLGNQPQHASGTKVDFGNLNFDITASDIEELCASVGEVRSANIVFDRAGRSTGHSTVIFARRSDALAAIQKFNGLALDGATMEVKLAGEGGRQNPFNPRVEAAPRAKQPRGGLFGSALEEDDEEEIVYPGRDQRPRSNSNPTFSVTFGGADNREHRPRRGKGPKGASRGSGRGNRQRKEAPKSQEDLDAEMDSYMAQKGDGPQE